MSFRLSHTITEIAVDLRAVPNQDHYSLRWDRARIVLCIRGLRSLEPNLPKPRPKAVTLYISQECPCDEATKVKILGHFSTATTESWRARINDGPTRYIYKGLVDAIWQLTPDRSSPTGLVAWCYLSWED